MSNKSIDFNYHFMTRDGNEFDYDVHIDPDTGAVVEPYLTGPDWTRLDYHQCEHCPLKTSDVSYCPLAVQISHAVEFFSATPSYDQLSLTITSKQRKMTVSSDAQNGIRSLMGLSMAVSGCPKTMLLRPMARFHLPLADLEETHYRVTSMFMLAQYFIHSEGKQADWKMEGLQDMYADLHTVNATMLTRMKKQISQDAPANALVILDAFAVYVSESISFDLQDLRKIFTQWIDKA